MGSSAAQERNSSRNIQDLDFEFKCGKLSDADYKQVRAEMTSDVAVVLEHIDKLEKSLDLDTLIRRETDAARATPNQRTRHSADRAERKNPPSNKFCSECGTQLNRS